MEESWIIIDSESSYIDKNASNISVWNFILDFRSEENSPIKTKEIYAVTNNKEIKIIVSKLEEPDINEIIIMIQDKTEIKELKKQLIVKENNIILIASSSHELRTPLDLIIKALEMLNKSLEQLNNQESTELESIIKEMYMYYETALSWSHHLLSTVNDVLVFS